MKHSKVSSEAGDAWRDYILQKIVNYLEAHREIILKEFEETNGHKISSQDIKDNDLLDFDIAITLHRDKKSSFGLGSGFFKANIIR